MARALKARWVWAASAALVLLPVLLHPAPYAAAAASRASGLPVRIESAYWRPTGVLVMNGIQVSDASSKTWLRSKRGEARLSLARGAALRLDLRGASLEPALLQSLLRSTPYAGGAGGLDVERARLVLSPGRLRLEELVSEPVRAAAELRWSKKRLDSAQAELSFARAALEKMPEDWRERLEEKDGRRSLRCEFRDGTLTLYGKNGPLLRASWEMVY